MSQDVMTIAELAVYLDIAESTLCKKVSTREIPFAKFGNTLRFTKVAIDAWLARNTTQPDESLFAEFARLQNRYHFKLWLEGRGVDWRTLSDEQLVALARKALDELRARPEDAACPAG
jgi:excisionase family DNA binding protein